MGIDEKRPQYDVLVVGAGVGGCALAAAFGRQGRSVLLLERDLSEPDRIVGELLQPGGVEALSKLGLTDTLQGIDAIPVEGYGILFHNQKVHIPYPVDPKTGKSVSGFAFHHGRFIQNLRKEARETPNVTLVEASVTELLKDNLTGQILGVKAIRKADKSGAKRPPEYFFASLNFIVDGIFSKFRSQFIDAQANVKSNFAALELKDAVLPFPHHGHCVLGDFAPILLYQIGTHETRALICTRGKELPKAEELREYIINVVIPGLPEETRPSVKGAVESGQRIRSMPNSFLRPTMNRTPGAIILGDAFNVRHPLTGGGMTVLFNDVLLLRDLLDRQHIPDLANTPLVLEQLGEFHWQRKNLSSQVNILAQALFSLFSANNRYMQILQRGCISYLGRGGECTNGPASLLSVNVQSPWLLFYHFFSVAFYAVGLHIYKQGLLLLPLSLVDSIIALWMSCMVIVPYMYTEICT